MLFRLGSARKADMTFAAFQLCLPPCQIQVLVMDMSRLKEKLCRSAAAQRTGPSARLQTAHSGVASADGQANGPGCCALDAAPGTALPGLERRSATKYKWTVGELIATINLIKSTDFKVEEVNVDLRHKRVAATIAKGHFTSHNMCESDLDGDQDLTLWLRSRDDIPREVLGDDILTYDRVR
jgi:hypothetical protein